MLQKAPQPAAVSETDVVPALKVEGAPPRTRRRLLYAVLIILAAGAIGLTWWLRQGDQAGSGVVVLYGNVDVREVQVAFNDSGRIAAVLAEEGDHVTKGQIIARLDTSRLELQVTEAEATVDGETAAVEKLHAGNRPEEIAQAEASLASAEADADNARGIYNRLQSLSASPSGLAAVTQQTIDTAKSALDSAAAKVALYQKALDLERAGSRKEDIAQGEAQLRSSQAQLALLRRELQDAALAAPIDAVVRSRLMEPGEMATSQTPVFSLAVTDPKWVRTYVSEPQLGAIKPGMAATITVDAFPGRGFPGKVGFISPVAEFTPTTVQTEELRSSLVYEVRVFVDDPNDDLRLGMPATLRLGSAANSGSRPP